MNRIATIYSITTTAGVAIALVSAVVWIIAAIRHRPTGAKVGVLVGLIIATVSLFLFVRSYDPSLRPPAEQDDPEPPSASQQQEAPPPTVTPQDEPESSDKGKDTTEHTPAPVEPSQATENPLLTVEVQTRPVMNGTQTERIGTWAFIQTTKETAKAATPEQFQRYMTGLDAEDYNWFNVFFEDGTGLYIASGTAGTWVEYGAIDQEEGGAVTAPDGGSVRYFLFDPDAGAYIEQ